MNGTMTVAERLVAELTTEAAATRRILERVPADIRADGGVARMSDPDLILKIMDTVSIPVMAKCRIGHFVEAQILEAIGVDYVDESEVLTPADEQHHILKHDFKVPFVCGARNLGEALRRIAEGAAMIRSKGEAGTGNVVEAVRHMRAIVGDLIEQKRMLTDPAWLLRVGLYLELLTCLGIFEAVRRRAILPAAYNAAGMMRR